MWSDKMLKKAQNLYSLPWSKPGETIEAIYMVQKIKRKFIIQDLVEDRRPVLYAENFSSEAGVPVLANSLDALLSPYCTG